MPFYNIKKIISHKPRIGLVLPMLNIASWSPLFLLVHITSSCDQCCEWCYQKQDQFFRDHQGDMRIDMFQKIVASTGLYAPHLHLFGGEPLFHPQFERFLDVCFRYRRSFSLTTNGNGLDQYGALIIASSSTQINISLNNLVDREGAINADLERKVINFIRLNAGKKTVNLNYVLCQATDTSFHQALMKFLRYCRKGEVASFVVQRYMSYGNRGDGPEDPTYFLKRVCSSRFEFPVICVPAKRSSTVTDSLWSVWTRSKCYVPWVGLSIYPDGAVTPGGGVGGCNCVIGDLAKESLWDIWRGRLLGDFRSTLRNKGLPPRCSSCCHKID